MNTVNKSRTGTREGAFRFSLSTFSFLNPLSVPSLRNTNRSLLRHTTRMLGGAPRPRPPDYLAMACRALKAILKIDKSLRPFMQEQFQLYEQHRFGQQTQAALQSIYGPGSDDTQPVNNR